MPAIPINPDKTAFIVHAEGGDAVVPLVFKLPNEGLFAWSAFAALERECDYAFLLESAETGKNGRYSFMGADPRRRIVLRGGRVQVLNAAGETLSDEAVTDPLTDLERALAPYQQPAVTGQELPPFLGGVVGYLGYDCVHYFEPVGEMKEDLLGVPDMLWMQTDCLAAFDHYRQELILVKNCYREDVADNGGDWGAAYDNACAQLRAFLARLQTAAPPPMHLPPNIFTPPLRGGAERSEAGGGARKRVRDLSGGTSPPLPQSNFSKDGFCEMVAQAKEYIRAGDIFQVVPSQRFTFPQQADAVSIYRSLRRINPSPYMFHLKCGDFSVVGSSPELMLSCQQRQLLVRPIAGSRPRGADAAQDAALAEELLRDEKEIAEHLMLVDLGRNDLGRVAEIGSVTVPEAQFTRIEKYSHIMHIVSDVQAVLAEGKTPFDAARATFPAGTLSGAPKVRAMQLINQFEPCKRNLYGGLAGYISHSGDMLTCIVIRTLVAKDGQCYVQAGGGIVADSQPQKEYEESVNKAMAALAAAHASQDAREAG